MTKYCHVCENLILEPGWLSTACYLCGPGYELGKNRAHSAVHQAIKKGKLKPVSEHNCVDCGKKAKFYDHRDYNKPLDVVPVCHSCNGLRGHGIALDMTNVKIRKNKERKTEKTPKLIITNPFLQRNCV